MKIESINAYSINVLCMVSLGYLEDSNIMRWGKLHINDRQIEELEKAIKEHKRLKAEYKKKHGLE